MPGWHSVAWLLVQYEPEGQGKYDIFNIPILSGSELNWWVWASFREVTNTLLAVRHKPQAAFPKLASVEVKPVMLDIFRTAPTELPQLEEVK